MNNFQDQVHIELIRRRLWCGREFGQSSVMIGSGFSRNAEKSSGNVKKFPLWKDVCEEMCKALYPMDTKSHLSKDALRLAYEYEAFFGTQELNDLIEKIIPDNNYSPGKLHELLLFLPWSDVFTTNYDTLLEKTLPKIHDQKYDVVLTPADIPGRMKPRIVKLHGSFPSIRPFVITEEHYRNYPKNNAPFVNMVQQSIMENVFCLIGFSGNDPNFLAWAGWVRDNLGDTRPNIYLCGVFDFSPSERKVLESRNIIPIDLSPLFPTTEWPDKDIRYARAIEWFLLNLLNGKPPDGLMWPSKNNPILWTPSPGLPEIPPPQNLATDPGIAFPEQEHISIEYLKEKVSVWKKQREEYPGWNVVPHNQREQLWSQMEHWIYPLINNIENFAPLERLFVLFELNWRLEKTLTPLFPYIAEKMVTTLKLFNPFYQLIALDTAIIRQDVREYKELEWAKIQDVWISLAFAIVRESRERQNDVEYFYWLNLLEKICQQNADWTARWFYEKSFYFLNKFDFLNVYKVLDAWPENFSNPSWEMKRASVLSEIGELEKAERIAEKALSEIRKRFRPYVDDCSLFSQESWGMLFLKALKNYNSKDYEVLVDSYRERSKKLKTYNCDPYLEMDMLELEVMKQSSGSNRRIKRDFDPGRITISHSLSSGLNVYQFRRSYAAFRIFEEGGIPFRCGNVTMFQKVVVNSAKFLKFENPILAFNLIVRQRHEETIKEWFDRATIATLSESEVDYFFSESMNAIKQLMQKIEDNSLSQVQRSGFLIPEMDIFTEFISRLSFRLNNQRLNDLLDVACEMHKKKPYYQMHFLQGNKEHLFKRAFLALEPSELCLKMTRLLTLPIPSENDFEMKLHEWKDPFELFEWPNGFKLENNFDRSAWNQPVLKLIDVVRDGKFIARKIATQRLTKLFQIGGLKDSEEKLFLEALWSRIGSKTGLPSETNFFHFSFLRLSSGSDDAKGKLKKYLLEWEGKSLVSYEQASDGRRNRVINLGQKDGAYSSYRDELFYASKSDFPEIEDRGIDWSADEAVKIFDKIQGWWVSESVNLTSLDFSDNPFNSLTEEISSIGEIAGKVILPRFGGVDGNHKESAFKLIMEMEQKGFCVLDVLPATLFVKPEIYNEIISKLQRGLNDAKFEVVDKAIVGVYRWLIYSSKNKIQAPPNDLLEEIINRLVLRRQPGLAVLLDVISEMVRKNLAEFSERQILSMLKALEHLMVETELKKEDIENEGEFKGAILVGEKPDYREKSSELAYCLYLKFKNEKKEMPIILNEWKTQSKNDVLPEVRRIWFNIE